MSYRGVEGNSWVKVQLPPIAGNLLRQSRLVLLNKKKISVQSHVQS